MLRLIQLETCESTNDEAWRLLPETALVVTRRQTRGRGRQGRGWTDGAGNVMASLALVPEKGLAARLSWVPLAAGVAAADAIGAAGGDYELPGLRLKWPNDIMWDDAKMGGILCESRLKGDALSGLVIGIGLNIAAAPSLEGVKTSCLAETLAALKNATAAQRDEKIETLRRRFVESWADRALFWLAELAAGRSSGLRRAWLTHGRLSKYADYEVRDSAGAKTRVTALDIDEAGRLVARTPGGETIHVDQAN